MPPTTKKASKAQDSKYAPTAWGGELLEDVTVPSGQTCQCRRPGMQGLIAKGILDKMDILTATVNDKHISRVKKGKAAAEQIVDDPAKLLEVLDSIDKVLCYIVVQPALSRPVVEEQDDDGNTVERPIEDDEREEGVVYTDRIDVEDKMFLFNFAVGGTRDVATFRQQSQAVVGSLGIQQDLAVPSE